MKKHLGFMFIVSRPCGRVAGYCWDDEGFEKEAAKWVFGMLRKGSGDAVKRIERFDGDPMPESMCPSCAGRMCQEGGAA